MKARIGLLINPLYLLAVLSIVLTACPPPADPPTEPALTTSNATSITTNSATSGGTISADGGASVTARGICWNTSSGPTISNSKTSDGTGTGNFTSSLSGLNPGATYYVRAYATNSVGTGYGNEISFTTLAALSAITTTAVASITATSATSGGNITSDGGGAITARGVCWSTSSTPTITNSKTTDGTGTGSFVSSITGLTAGVKYYVRAYATNSAGTSYGPEVSFTALANLPTLTTMTIAGITTTGASSGGNVSADGGAGVTARGVCWNTASGPTISNNKTSDGVGTGSYTSVLTSLTAGTVYYVRAYATNSAGTAYGNELSFTTLLALPTVTTNAVTGITSSSATSGGNITTGAATVTARGVCWSTNQTPTIADAKTTETATTSSFTSNLTGLAASTTYYVRAYATNSSGTAYGNVVSFTTLSNLPTVTDIDGNVYHYITIGTQQWMVENLKTTRYRNGDAIPYITSADTWSKCLDTSSPAYCNYGNDPNNANTYGRLYNWYAVNDSRYIAPTGWHVPTEAEWTTLANYLGGESIAAGKLKEAGLAHWYSPNTDATNSSGFTALPGGHRDYAGAFSLFGTRGIFWSANQFDNANAYHRNIFYDNSDVFKGSYYFKNLGFSVRCIKGEPAVPSNPPAVSTTAVSNVTASSATSGGNVTSDGGATVTARGVCWSTSQNPTTANSKTTDGIGTGSFTSTLTNLNVNTTYYVRAYATNTAGTNYGSQVTFTTPSSINGIIFNPNKTYGTLTDIGGNVYKTIVIGTQTWMAENLRTTLYNDGNSIPSTTDNITWRNLTTPAYCFYNNDVGTYRTTYGALYNWFTVNTGKLCPTGWHVPVDSEWTTLVTYLGGTSVAGAKLKETTKAHWYNVTEYATNESGFTALPGGGRYADHGATLTWWLGIFSDLGGYGTWWSRTEINSINSSYWYTYGNTPEFLKGNDLLEKQNGFSVRCLKD